MPEGTGLIYNTVHAEQGDSLEVPRDIDLYKNFKEETDMESVAEKLIDQGFTVTVLLSSKNRPVTADKNRPLRMTVENLLTVGDAPAIAGEVEDLAAMS